MNDVYVCAMMTVAVAHVAALAIVPPPAVAPRVLFESAIARVTLTTSSNRTRSLCIESLGDGSLGIDEFTVSGVLNATETLLEDGVPFKTMWKLKTCPVPSPSIVFRCLRWALMNKRRLDASNRRMAIVLPHRPPILLVVNQVLRAFGPKCPVHATSDEREAEQFLDENVDS